GASRRGGSGVGAPGHSWAGREPQAGRSTRATRAATSLRGFTKGAWWVKVGSSGPMLLGEHEHALDEKNRLTLPARLREQLGERLVVTQGLDGCLYLYAAAEWHKLAERVGSLDPLSQEARTMQRFFFASAADVGLDKQGRFV